jgi:hypothetical protein
LDLIFLNLAGFMAFSWILAGFLEPQVVLYFWMEVIIIIILTGILWALFNPKEPSWETRTDLALFEFEIRHELFSRIIDFIAFILICSYGIFGLLCYFHGVFLPEDIPLNMLKVATLFILISMLIISLPIIIGIIISKNVNHDIRNVILIFQFGYLGLNGLLFYWVFWCFGIQAIGPTKFRLSEFSTKINNVLLILMIALFILAFLLPYLCGWRRTKSAHELILQKKMDLLDDLSKVLKFSGSIKFKELLKNFDNNVINEKKIFEQRDKMVPLLLEWKIDAKLDYRCKYIKFLDHILCCNSQLEILSGTGGSTFVNEVQHYLDVVVEDKSKLENRFELEKKSRPQLWIGLVTIISPMLAPILNELVIWMGIPIQSTEITKLISATITGVP